MSRNSFVTHCARVAVALGLFTSGIALADDNSMSQWTGDSYAYFNGLDYQPGHFNTARAPQLPDDERMPDTANKTPERFERRVLIASRPLTRTPTNPFRDDTGA